MIKLAKITKKYGKHIVLDNISSDIPDGINCLIGKSGCGKTTLSRIIAGIEKPDKGIVSGITGNVTFMYQDLRLFPSLSALENLTIVVGKENQQESEELLYKLGMSSDDALKKPDELSGGMCQRTALARAILFDRYYGGNTVVLDEPFGKLDESTKKCCIDIVKSCFADKNLIIITHDINEANSLDANILYFDILTEAKS